MAGRTEAAPVLEPPLTSSDDPRPVERAVVDGIAGDFGPETFL